MPNHPIDFSTAAREMLLSDEALTNVLRALYAAKGGFYVDPSKEAPENVIPLSAYTGAGEAAASVFADKSLELVRQYFAELDEYRKDRTAWLAQQAEGAGDGPMESAGALSASLAYLVNKRYALTGEAICFAAPGEGVPQTVHQLFSETPMAGLLSAAIACPALEQDQVVRLSCLLGMLAYIAIKTPEAAPEGVSPDLSFFASVLWSAALTQIKCGKEQDAAAMQDAAVVALCMLCVYTYADSWETQTECLDSLKPLTRLNARMLQALTDREMPVYLCSRALLLDRLSPQAAQLVCDHLIGALHGMIPEADGAQIEAQDAKLTQELKDAWTRLIRSHFAPAAPEYTAAWTQTDKEDNSRSETHSKPENENGV